MSSNVTMPFESKSNFLNIGSIFKLYSYYDTNSYKSFYLNG